MIKWYFVCFTSCYMDIYEKRARARVPNLNCKRWVLIKYVCTREMDPRAYTYILIPRTSREEVNKKCHNAHKEEVARALHASSRKWVGYARLTWTNNLDTFIHIYMMYTTHAAAIARVKQPKMRVYKYLNRFDCEIRPEWIDYSIHAHNLCHMYSVYLMSFWVFVL